MSWLTGPIVAWDTETDSVDPTDAHIVTCCIGVGDARTGSWESRNWLLKPDRPIAAEATAVHGITTEYATEHGMDRERALDQIRDELVDAGLRGYPVVGHNAPYDFTVLDRECRRNGLGGVSIAGPVLDTLVLWRRFDRITGSRSLTALAARHGIEFPAHDAEADALASLRLLHILGGTNDLLPLIEPTALHEAQIGWWAQQQDIAEANALGNGSHFTRQPHWPLIPHTTESE